MSKRFRKYAEIVLTVSFLILSLSACKGIELENKTEQVEEYTKEQSMIFLANERNRYQNAYSADIWTIVTDEKGTTFDELMIDNVKEYLEQIKLLCMLAEERGISVTSRERDQIRQMTDEYMAGLTDADISYIGCSRDDVQKMYVEYYTACKVAENMIKSGTVDISDSEVKVIRIMQIGTTDLKKAKAILKKVKIDKADFNSMASRYSELGQIEVEMKKGTGGGLLEATAFSLEEGKISNILGIGDMYYIIKCVNGYDREETESRKNALETAVNSLNFSTSLEPYAKEHNIVFFEAFWNEVDFHEGADSTADNFYDIFDKYKE